MAVFLRPNVANGPAPSCLALSVQVSVDMLNEVVYNNQPLEGRPTTCAARVATTLLRQPSQSPPGYRWEVAPYTIYLALPASQRGEEKFKQLVGFLCDCNSFAIDVRNLLLCATGNEALADWDEETQYDGKQFQQLFQLDPLFVEAAPSSTAVARPSPHPTAAAVAVAGGAARGNSVSSFVAGFGAAAVNSLRSAFTVDPSLMVISGGSGVTSTATGALGASAALPASSSAAQSTGPSLFRKNSGQSSEASRMAAGGSFDEGGISRGRRASAASATGGYGNSGGKVRASSASSGLTDRTSSSRDGSGPSASAAAAAPSVISQWFSKLSSGASSKPPAATSGGAVATSTAAKPASPAHSSSAANDVSGSRGGGATGGGSSGHVTPARGRGASAAPASPAASGMQSPARGRAASAPPSPPKWANQRVVAAFYNKFENTLTHAFLYGQLSSADICLEHHLTLERHSQLVTLACRMAVDPAFDRCAPKLMQWIVMDIASDIIALERMFGDAVGEGRKAIITLNEPFAEYLLAARAIGVATAAELAQCVGCVLVMGAVGVTSDVTSVMRGRDVTTTEAAQRQAVLAAHYRDVQRRANAICTAVYLHPLSAWWWLRVRHLPLPQQLQCLPPELAHVHASISYFRLQVIAPACRAFFCEAVLAQLVERTLTRLAFSPPSVALPFPADQRENRLPLVKAAVERFVASASAASVPAPASSVALDESTATSAPAASRASAAAPSSATATAEATAASPVPAVATVASAANHGGVDGSATNRAPSDFTTASAANATSLAAASDGDATAPAAASAGAIAPSSQPAAALLPIAAEGSGGDDDVHMADGSTGTGPAAADPKAGAVPAAAAAACDVSNVFGGPLNDSLNFTGLSAFFGPGGGGGGNKDANTSGASVSSHILDLSKSTGTPPAGDRLTQDHPASSYVQKGTFPSFGLGSPISPVSSASSPPAPPQQQASPLMTPANESQSVA